MKSSLRLLTPLCAFVLATASAHAQFYKLHNADVGGGAIGQFTTTLPAGNSSSITDDTANSFGGMFTLRDHPVPWAGIEFNYAYTEYTQYYTGVNSTGSVYTAHAHNDVHEATAGYLFHPHFRKLQPFISLGGGYLDFVPTNGGSNQWRGTGLIEAGLDIPTANPHMGFRVQGRELIYRAPDYFQSNLASRTWVATSEPSLGVWYRF